MLSPKTKVCSVEMCKYLIRVDGYVNGSAGAFSSATKVKWKTMDMIF